MSTTATTPEQAVDAQPANSEQAKPMELPNDHPLVTALAAQKEEIKTLKEKAARLDQLEEAQKSAEEKAAEREAAALKRAADAEAKALRREVALENNLSKDDAALLDTVNDEDAVRALAKRLAADAKRKSGNYVPSEGNNQPAPADERRAFVRRLTGRE